MYLPRALISHLYLHLAQTHHPLSPPVLLLVALEPDALCACRILTALLKRDYIAHKIQPVSGYGDLSKAGENMVAPMKVQNGGNGGLIVCLGVGGLVDMSTVLGLDAEGDGEDPSGGVEVWLIDARRPWNLGNVFAGNPQNALREVNGNSRTRAIEVEKGKLLPAFKPGQGGIIVYDDGDIDEELNAEREAYCALTEMAEAGIDAEDDSDISDGDSDVMQSIEDVMPSKKRKSSSDRDEEEEHSNEENRRPRQRRRSDSVGQCVLVQMERPLIPSRAARHLHHSNLHHDRVSREIVAALQYLPLSNHRHDPHWKSNLSNYRNDLFAESSSWNVKNTTSSFTNTMRSALLTPSLSPQSSIR